MVIVAGELYSSTVSCCYQLRSMSLQECGSLRAAAAWRDPGDRWHFLCNDQQCELSSWQQLCDCCTSSRLLPELLFFEINEGSSKVL